MPQFRFFGVTGGPLAVDLSARVEAVGEQGFRGMLKNPNFPVMRKIYADKPLTERRSRAGRLRQGCGDSQVPPHRRLLSGGGVGVFVCLIVD